MNRYFIVLFFLIFCLSGCKDGRYITSVQFTSPLCNNCRAVTTKELEVFDDYGDFVLRLPKTQNDLPVMKLQTGTKITFMSVFHERTYVAYRFAPIQEGYFAVILIEGYPDKYFSVRNIGSWPANFQLIDVKWNFPFIDLDDPVNDDLLKKYFDKINHPGKVEKPMMNNIK